MNGLGLLSAFICTSSSLSKAIYFFNIHVFFYIEQGSFFVCSKNHMVLIFSKAVWGFLHSLVRLENMALD